MKTLKFSGLLKTTIILSVFVCLLSVNALCSERGELPYGLKYIDVTESVVMAQSDFGANMVCISSDKGLVFADSCMRTEAAAKFRIDMERRFKKETYALVLTHAHIDHFFGMAAFKDVKVIAAKTGRKIFLKQLSVKFDERKIRGYENIFPKFRESVKTAAPFLPETFMDKAGVIADGRQKILFGNTGGHSVDSSYLFFPSEKVFVAGDLVQVDQYIYFGDSTTDLDSWIKALKKWYKMDIDYICPGHGKLVKKEFLPQIWKYFEALIRVVKDLKKRGVPVKEVVSHPELPSGFWSKDIKEPSWYKFCIYRLYKSLAT